MLQLYTVEETAEQLRVKPATIRRWVFERKIEVVRIGRAVRIPRHVIEGIIQQGTCKPISVC